MILDDKVGACLIFAFLAIIYTVESKKGLAAHNMLRKSEQTNTDNFNFMCIILPHFQAHPNPLLRFIPVLNLLTLNMGASILICNRRY